MWFVTKDLLYRELNRLLDVIAKTLSSLKQHRSEIDELKIQVKDLERTLNTLRIYS